MEVVIERGEINTERKPKRKKPSSYHLSLNSPSAFMSDKTDLPSSKSFHQGDICIQLTIQHKCRIIISSVAWQWNCISKSPALASHFLFQALFEVLLLDCYFSLYDKMKYSLEVCILSVSVGYLVDSEVVIIMRGASGSFTPSEKGLEIFGTKKIGGLNKYYFENSMTFYLIKYI